MAPATPVAGDTTTTAAATNITSASDVDVSYRDKLNRWSENNKVYTRKFHRKPKPPADISSTAPPLPPPPPSNPPRDPPAAAAADVASSKPSPPEDTAASTHQHSGGDAAASSLQQSGGDTIDDDYDDGDTRRFNLRWKSKDEIHELKKKLLDELEQIRSLERRIDAECGSHSLFQHSANGPKPLNLSSCPVMVAETNGNGLSEQFYREELLPQAANLNSLSRPTSYPSFRHLTVNTNNSMVEGFEKEKRTPKANQYYKHPDFVLIGKDNKFPYPTLSSNKKLKPNGSSNSLLEKKHAQAFRNCATLLSRLMKHKFGWVFNTPVDVKGLGLHDYYSIINHPMDLGTVKTRLNKNWYKSPGEFAEDVRLTFRNAMTYNPKGQDVHTMAEQLLQIFEERWPSIEAEYSYIPYPPTPVARKPLPVDVGMLERSDSTLQPFMVEPRAKTKSVSHLNPVGRPPAPKQPKPKAKDLYKREMTFEEKQKLGHNLQNLPPEKLDAVVQIIRRSNSSLCQQGDEIEVDIDSVDTETLWELDRLVTNYKKSLSKHKRKAELALLAKAKAEGERGQERVVHADVAEEAKVNHTVDTKEVGSSFPIGGETIRENGSGSSSSSSSGSGSDSSSSDSDSDSS